MTELAATWEYLRYPDWQFRAYLTMRAALPMGPLTPQQDRYLWWIAGWDQPTVAGVCSLLRFAGTTQCGGDKDGAP